MPAYRPWFHFRNDCNWLLFQWCRQVSPCRSFNCQQATTKMHLVFRLVLLFNKWSDSLFRKRPQLEVSPLSWLSLSQHWWRRMWRFSKVDKNCNLLLFLSHRPADTTAGQPYRPGKLARFVRWRHQFLIKATLRDTLSLRLQQVGNNRLLLRSAVVHGVASLQSYIWKPDLCYPQGLRERRTMAPLTSP